MRAMVLEAPGTVLLAEVPSPVPRDGEAVLRVEAAGICGSELHAFHSPAPRVLPLVMGHEFTGATVAGDRVVVNPLMVCGRCACCRDGRPELCGQRRIVGIDVPGAFADLVAVPLAALTRIDASVSPERGSLVEPLANAVHAWGRVALAGTSRVAVVGGGPIGLMAVDVAVRLLGLAPAVVEPRATRRAVAVRLGATSVHATGPELLLGAEPFDTVVDAVGSPESRAVAMEAIRPGGTVVCIGLASAEAGVETQVLVRQEKTLTGSFCYTPADFAVAVGLARDLDTGWVDTVSLADAATVFEDLARGRSTIVKAVVRP
jgi:threonine dehydrogenase-like Zn-dependent dehydrogenase